MLAFFGHRGRQKKAKHPVSEHPRAPCLAGIAHRRALMVDRVRLLEASRTERIALTASEVLDLTRHSAEGQREIITPCAPCCR